MYLLDAMQNFTNYDAGIEPLLGKNFITCLNNLLVDNTDVLKLGVYRNRIQSLSLRVLGNLSLNHEGKQEAIDNKIILNAWKFLSSNDFQVRFNASYVLMSCNIHLDGKK